MTRFEDHHTSTPDAAAAFEAAATYEQSRLELAEEAGYTPPEWPESSPRYLDCPPALLAAIRNASRLAEEARARDAAGRKVREETAREWALSEIAGRYA